MQKRKLTRTFVLVLLLSLMAACGGNGNDSSGDNSNNSGNTAIVDGNTSITSDSEANTGLRPTLPPSVELVTGADMGTENSTTASLRFFNALQDVERVTVVIDDVPVFRGVATNVATLPIGREPGTYTIDVIHQPVGRAQTGDEAVYYSGMVDIADNERLALILEGTSDENTLITLIEDTSPLNPGEARLQFLNLLQREVPLRFEQQGITLVDGVASQTSSTPVVLEAASYTLDVLDGDALVVSGDVDLDVGTVTTGIVLNTSSGPELFTFENSTPPQTRVRFTHAAPDTPPLQVWLDGELKFSTIAFGETTEFEILPSTLFTVDLYRGGESVTVDETTEPAQSTSFRLPDFATVEVVIYGPDVNLLVNPFELDTSPVLSNSSRVTFINVAFEQPTLEMFYANREDSFLTISYDRSITINLPPAQTRLNFFARNAAEGIPPVESNEDQIELLEGNAYSYVIVGRSGNQALFTPIDFVESVSPTQDESLVETADLTTIQVVNAWNQTIQVNVGETRVALGLEPGRISEPAQIQATTTLVELLNPEGNLLFEQTFGFDSEIPNYMLFVSQADAGVLLTMAVSEVVDAPIDRAQIRLIHAHPGFDQFFVTIEAESSAVADDDSTPEVVEPVSETVQLLNRSASEWIDLEAGAFSINISDRETRTFIFDEVFTLSGGTLYDIVFQQGTEGRIIATVFERPRE